MTNYYQLLGINKSATSAEIKKAYRKMAAQHHPDKGGDTAKFQEVQKAYETLSDDAKRHEYDNPSPFRQHSEFEFNFGGGHPGHPGDIFSQFFRQQGFHNGFHGQHDPFQQHHPRKNKDLRVAVSVTLSSTLSSQSKTLNVRSTKGDNFEVTIAIPQGASDGTTIKYTGMGDNFFENLPRGDLYVIIQIPHEPNFQIHGNSLITNLEINSIEAMLGCDKEITGIDEKTYLIKIPKGCQYGAKFGLNGQGLCNLNSPIRGDLIVNVTITTLTLTPEQETQIRHLWQIN